MNKKTSVNIMTGVLIGALLFGPAALWAMGSVAFTGDGITFTTFVQITVFWILSVLFGVLLFALLITTVRNMK